MASKEDIGEMNLYQKLAKIKKGIGVIRKNKEGYGYMYVPEDEILSRIEGAMERYHVSLFPGICPNTSTVTPYSYSKTKFTKKGDPYEDRTNDVIVSADMAWTWVNIDDPSEKVVVPWLMVGQQSDAAQAFGAGLTYSSRYFLLKYFNVPTVDSDPDAYRSKKRAAEAEADREIANEIINSVDSLIRGFVNVHPERKKDVREFCEKYVTEGDYFKITESALASKMLQEFKSSFEIKTETEG